MRRHRKPPSARMDWVGLGCCVAICGVVLFVVGLADPASVLAWGGGCIIAGGCIVAIIAASRPIN